MQHYIFLHKQNVVHFPMSSIMTYYISLKHHDIKIILLGSMNFTNVMHEISTFWLYMVTQMGGRKENFSTRE